jgi:hypothetical protein
MTANKIKARRASVVYTQPDIERMLDIARPVTALALGPDCRALLAGSADGSTLLLDLPGLNYKARRVRRWLRC